MLDIDADVIFWSVFGFMWVEFLWELYLSTRQQSVFCKTEKPPVELGDICDEETFQKARLYGLDKSAYSIVHDIFKQVLSSALMLLNMYAVFWAISGKMLVFLNLPEDAEISRSLVCMFLLSLFGTVIDLPFTIYYTFWLEERHGFNKQTPGFFIKDVIKKFFVGEAISLPLIAALIAIVQWGGDYFFVHLWAFATLVLLLFMTVYPDYIAPLFDKYSPLPEGELRTNIEKLAASIEFPLQKLYVVEGSKRSSHSNAYFYGFFKNKRIVLFDTLLADYKKDQTDEKMEPQEKKDDQQVPSEKTRNTKGCSNEEILAVLGHELGHWKLNHVLKNIIISEANILFMFLVFNLLFKFQPLYSAFGFTDSQPIFIGLYIVTSYIFSPYNAILSFLMTTLSRRFEFQADQFAKKLGKATPLKAALVKLNKDNLGFPVYDWLYSSWHHSHPTLLQRIKALEKSD